jgi:diguanylate cyclase (GGDEF)-like protein
VKEFSFSSKLYILSTLIIGGTLCLQLPDLSGTRLWLFLIAAAVTTFTQIIQVEGIIKDSSYNASVFGYSLALLALGRAEATWVVLISFLAAWIWKKRVTPWFALGFNIGSTTISLALADLVYQFIPQGNGLYGLHGMAGIIVAGSVYIVLSQSMTGLVYWLIEGTTFRESGHLSRLLLVADATQFAMGASAALIWSINLYAILFTLSPLYLIYLTLQLPVLQLRSQTDSKTGLYNHHYFYAALEKELARADRANMPLSVVMSDMDYLRTINNTYGHLAGDTTLIAVSETLKKLVRNYDIVARFGGEEFVIIMPETTPEKAAIRVEEIRQVIESTPIDISPTTAPLHVTMSFGIAGREHSGQKPSQLVNNADLALYQAKQTGRNRVCRYSTTITEQIT